MTRKEKIKKAHEDLKQVMVREVTGPGDGAYFMTTYTEKDGMGMTFGGRADLVGIAVSHTLAKYVLLTPGLDEGFISTIAGYATELLREQQEGIGDLQ